MLGKLQNPYKSFCPVYEDNQVEFFVNGYDRSYFEVLHDHLLKAEKEVYINDWWLSPELYLKRPWRKYPESRLDRVL